MQNEIRAYLNNQSGEGLPCSDRRKLAAAHIFRASGIPFRALAKLLAVPRDWLQRQGVLVAS